MSEGPQPGFKFAVSCPGCGGRVNLEGEGGFSDRERRALVRCTSCRTPWALTVSLSPAYVPVRLPGEDLLTVPRTEHPSFAYAEEKVVR